MTEDELTQLQQSYCKLNEASGKSPAYFYHSLFHHAPELRQLFREDLEGQGMKFMTTLGVIIARLNDESAVAPQFQQLGKTHASLGVLTEHFAPMEEALVDTLRHALGKEMTQELEALWRTAFKEIAVKMIERGGIPGQ
ncbi:globin [Leisingera sp. S132]|uniref:globin domain-containing protein n=1 Tax=Leisingera sp. S132 TaxID=2867016 RepID=UPI0021A8CA90|nr:globin domain-containing protein [Leisingera sp. S132]UWQ80744.1 globin [Leisingera sp. S132]